MHTAVLAVDTVVAACSVAVGFLAGIKYTGRRLPHVLAQMSPDEIRVVARRARTIREHD